MCGTNFNSKVFFFRESRDESRTCKMDRKVAHPDSYYKNRDLKNKSSVWGGPGVSLQDCPVGLV